MASNLMQLYREAITNTKGTGANMGGAMDRFKNFDASAGFDTAVRGATDNARRAFGDDIEGLKGSSVRNGRLNTGFFDEDAGRMYERSNANLNNTISQYAMASQGQQMDANSRYLGAQQNQQNQYLDLLSGGIDRETAEENARKQRRASMMSGMMSLAGTAIGAFGGPAGAAIGGKVGGMLGGMGRVTKAVGGDGRFIGGDYA